MINIDNILCFFNNINRRKGLYFNENSFESFSVFIDGFMEGLKTQSNI